MCESNVFIKKNNQLKLLMENVASITPHKGCLLLKGLLGEQKEVKAKISEINLIDHKIVLEEES